MNSPQKNNTPNLRHPGDLHRNSGMTLLELTVVILVLMTLVGLLLVGASAWKRGSDRTLCIMMISNVQKGVRSFSNLNGYSPGENAPDLQNKVIGLGRFVEKTPECPTDGIYTFGATFGSNTIPQQGSLYMECSLQVSEEHQPAEFSSW